jgi:hypothetical protein
MAEQREKVTTIQMPKAELRIEEDTGSSGTIIRLQGVSAVTAPRVGETIELNQDKFKVVEVSHRFSGSPLKHVVVITVEKPQPTVAQ